MTRGAIFDLDGTLLASMHVWEQVDVDFLSGFGLAVPPDYVPVVAEMGMEESAAYTVRRFGLPLTPRQVIDRWREMVRAQYHHEVQLKPGAASLLHALADRGWRLAVATALESELYRPCLARLGILTLFSAFAEGSESRDKAYPDLYLLAASRMGVAPERCVVFEDIVKGVRGAKAAGMRTVGVYDDTSAAQWPLLQSLADQSVRSLEELL